MLVARRRAPGGRLHGRGARRARAARATTVELARRAAAGRGKFENLNALLRRRTRPRTLDWLLVLDDDVALPRGFLDALPVPRPSDVDLRLAQPAHRLHSHAAWPRDAPARAAAPCARRRSSRSARSRAFASRHVRDAAAVPAAADGLGPRRPLGGARARARLADRDRRRDARSRHTLRPSPSGYPRDAAVAEARAFLAGRPYVRREATPADAARRTARLASAREGRGRRRVLPARPRPGARRLGAPPGARRARRRRRRPRARAAPPRAATARRRRAGRRARRRARWPRSPRRDDARRPRRALRALRRAAARRAPTASWGAWAAPPLALALRRCARASRSTSSTPTTPCRPPTRCCARAPGAPLVVSVHGGDVLFTALRVRGGARAVRRVSSARGSCSPTARASSAPARDLGARRRRVVHLGTDVPPASALRAGGPADARHRRRTSSRASATPTSCARSGCCATRHPELRYVVVGDGPERARARAADRRARPAPTASSSPGSSRTTRRCAARAHGAACSSCRASTRPSASPTSRRWPAGCRRSARAASPGREEIAAAGGGMRLVPPGDVEALAARARRAARRAALPPRARRAPPARRSRARFTLGGLRARDGGRLRGRAAVSRPVLFVTNHVPPDRAGAFARAARARADRARALRRALAPRDRGRRRTPASPIAASTSARSTRSRRPGATGAVVCGTAGRIALPAAFDGRAPRAACRSSSGARSGATCGRPPTCSPGRCCATIYRDADAVVAYGPHVAAYARAHGARRVARRAAGRRPALLDGAGARCRGAPRRSPRCSSGAPAPEKGLAVLLAAWAPRACRTRARRSSSWAARLRSRPRSCATFYAGADVVVIPSIRHAALPRAVGARRQRGHAPAHRRHRHRRRRRRRRRSRPRRRRPASSCRPATRRRSPARCDACTPTPRCANGSPAPARARPRRTTSRPGPAASRRRWPPRGSRGGPC